MKKRSEILGECFHKSRRRLISLLIRKAFEADGILSCARCGEEIEDVDFHIDHLIAWQNSDDPVNLFFNLKNIGLSHPECNSSARFIKHKRSIQDRVVNRLLTRRTNSRIRKRLAKKDRSDL
jgi:hypothetical protein